MDWWAPWVLLLGGGLGIADAAPPCAALAALDARRTVAFASDSAELLDEVYAEGSVALDEDAAVLASYRERGFVVLGAQLDVMSCDASWRGPDSVTLDVVDRLGRAIAVNSSGEVVALPRDRATKRTVHLVRSSGHWRIE